MENENLVFKASMLNASCISTNYIDASKLSPQQIADLEKDISNTNPINAATLTPQQIRDLEKLDITVADLSGYANNTL